MPGASTDNAHTCMPGKLLAEVEDNLTIHMCDICGDFWIVQRHGNRATSTNWNPHTHIGRVINKLVYLTIYIERE